MGSLENCDHLAHYRPHVAASSDATAAVSQSAHVPTVWLSLTNTHTSAHRVTRPARALSLYSLTLFNPVMVKLQSLRGLSKWEGMIWIQVAYVIASKTSHNCLQPG